MSADTARLAPERVCVIGAGSSGIVTVKALLDAGVAFDCFEEGDRIGGLWVFKNGNGRSAAYRSLSINTSRERMQYADFPMPADYPDYPGHAQIAAYFQSYVDHFGLTPHIRFRERVEQVRPANGGGFQVRTSGSAERHYGAVVVANGHHWDPSFPDPPVSGTFTGISLHSSAYVDPTEPHDLRGKRVIVVGIGNSAVDIASELARSGARVFLSVRRGAWILPKYVFGRPLDQLGVTPSFLPLAARQTIGHFLYRLIVGNPKSFGLPAPDHRIGNAHPTVSSDLLPLLREKRITPKPEILAFADTSVAFKDGTRETADAVIYATGYKVTFPFFDPAFVSAPNNELPLYFRTLHPVIPHLYFIGLAQPLGAIMPIAEAQAKLVADAIAGRYRPPAPEVMLREADAERAGVRQRYVASRRHTMQVDFDEFMAALRGEHEQGRTRPPAG
ncbi:MAG TPA: NAD(P)-binding domain-containing protein [Polyangiaceae bacterium]